MTAIPEQAPEQDFRARLQAAGLDGLAQADVAWLRKAYATSRAFRLPPECAPTTLPAAVFVPIARED